MDTGQILEFRSIALWLLAVVMVACGSFLTSDTVGVALIVVGAGMFFISSLLPTLSEFSIGPGGFSAKLRERDQEVRVELSPDVGDLAAVASRLTGSEKGGEELLERALVETYMRWKQAKQVGPLELVRRQLDELASAYSATTQTSVGDG